MVPDIHNAITKFRNDHNMHNELKWTKITDQKEEQYRALVDYFFAMNNQNLLQFHCIAFDNHAADHKAYNESDADKALSKLYYQLMVHRFGRNCGPDGDLCVAVDRRNSSTSLEDLRRMANAAIARDCGVQGSPIKQVLPLDSKQDDLLQLNDVILGAVCAARNGRHLLNQGRQSKRNIAEAVLKKSGLVSFEKDSPRNVHRFTVWNLRMKPRLS